MAGPVTVGGFIAGPFLDFAEMESKSGLVIRDSKKMSVLQRSFWHKYLLKNHRDCVAVRSFPASFIDRYGIACAVKTGVRMVLGILLERIPEGAAIDLFLDGSLYIQGQKRNGKGQILNVKTRNTSRSIQVRTVVRGDSSIKAISLAAVFAKVYRDQLVEKMGRTYEHYGFEKNKGYGTSRHLEAIRRHGPSPYHRLTFISKYLNL